MSIRKDAPEGAQILDLGAARAARSEAGQTNPFLKLTAGFVEVRTEVPLTAMDAFTAGNLTRGLTSLLADPADATVLLEDGLTTADVAAIIRFISGLDQGESSASPAS